MLLALDGHNVASVVVHAGGSDRRVLVGVCARCYVLWMANLVLHADRRDI